MRIEVLVSGENPVFYDLNKPKLIVGSDLACDVIISHPDVSRQHIIIMSEGDSFSVMDRGSTNGTYLNEERLIPGRRVDFTSFFPVRLGTDILISLLSDEDGLAEDNSKISIPIPKSIVEKAAPAHASSNSDATRVISLKDLKEAKTETLVKKRTEIKKASAANSTNKNIKVPAKKKKSFKMTSAHWGALAVVGIGIYLNNPFEKGPEPVVVKKEEVLVDENGLIIDRSARRKPIVEEVKQIDKYAINDLVTASELPKCFGDEIKKLCGFLVQPPVDPFGVSKLKDSYYFIINGAPYLQLAKELLTTTPSVEGKTEPTEDELWFLAAAFFFVDGFKFDNLTGFEKKDFIFGFTDGENAKIFKGVAVINSEKLPGMKFILLKRRVEAVKENGIAALNFTKTYYEFFGSEKLK